MPRPWIRVSAARSPPSEPSPPAVSRSHRAMPQEYGFDPTMTVPAAVIDLLLVALPSNLKRMTAALATQVLARSNVAPHAAKRWGDLLDDEANAIARECGLAARVVIAQAAAAARVPQRPRDRSASRRTRKTHNV